MISQKGKVSPVVLIIILIVLGSLGGLAYFLQKERAININLQQQLTDIKEKQRITEAKLDESKNMISTLEVKLKETQTQIDSLTTDLEAEKIAKVESQNEAQRLRAELDQQKILRVNLEKQFNEAQGQFRKTQNQLSQLETQKTELEEKVKTLEAKSRDLEAKVQGIELGTIVVSPEAKQPAKKAKKAKEVKKEVKKASPAPVKEEVKRPAVVEAAVKLEGNVLVVNKDYNFVVINLGGKEGVKAGDVFGVYHNEKYIGEVKVEKVHESMSAAGLASANMKDGVNEGDKVVQKL
ncbi:MAG: hypothetical protein MUC39_03055 [Candidatus Omnitrophica bacterium]|jgi:myosin heavy subunit|nr:hypothetical protein [Candidatus Omnitrophota bacterium]